jgi:uncharacterized protein GlcG (DUF336 family)
MQKVTVFLLSLLFLFSFFGLSSSTFNECSVSLNEAKAMIQSSFDTARANFSTIGFAIVVVNKFAEIKGMIRMDGTPLGSIDVALKKSQVCHHV